MINDRCRFSTHISSDYCRHRQRYVGSNVISISKLSDKSAVPRHARHVTVPVSCQQQRVVCCTDSIITSTASGRSNKSFDRMGS